MSKSVIIKESMLHKIVEGVNTQNVLNKVFITYGIKNFEPRNFNHVDPDDE